MSKLNGVKLEGIELDVSKELMNIGLLKAADAFSTFTKSKVLIESIELGYKVRSELSHCSTKKGSNIHVLITEIKGDVKGINYIIFSEQEIKDLLKISLPMEILSDLQKLKIMGNAFLLEMDNIIVGSVNTQFSNLLQSQMFGDVPALCILEENQLDEFILGNGNILDKVLLFKSNFIVDNVNMNPDFIRIFEDEFISEVKALIKKEKIVEKLKTV